jgi:hypothetical protein
MKMFKYKLPERVAHLFLDDKITDVTYNEITYVKDASKTLKLLGSINMNQLDDVIAEYNYLNIMQDFHLVVTQDDEFKKKIESLMKEIDGLLKLPAHNFYLLTISNTSYNQNLTFIVNKDSIFKITDNATEGINNNLVSHLKGKSKFLENFSYTIEIKDSTIIEDVFKYYYYDENYEDSTGSGAGTLTGWITDEEAINRSRGKTLIKLNRNFRLKK